MSIYSPGIRRRSFAFTLIEMLMVIAIIGILAALVVGLAGRSAEAKIDAAARAFIGQVEMAIDGYKDEKGFYPPENFVSGNINVPELPPLYYSLKGTIKTNGNFKVSGTDHEITPTALQNMFRLPEFVNSAPEGQESKVKDFFKSLNPRNVQETNGVRFLAFPVKGPHGDFNPLHYDASSQDRHNHETYDIWLEIVVGGKTNIIGNWRQ